MSPIFLTRMAKKKKKKQRSAGGGFENSLQNRPRNGSVLESQMAPKRPIWGWSKWVKMVKTGLKWPKTTQNVSKKCFYDFLKKFIFSDFLTQNGRKRLSPGGAKWAKKAHLGAKMGQKWSKLA
jgi:hypothetical protein